MPNELYLFAITRKWLRTPFFLSGRGKTKQENLMPLC